MSNLREKIHDGRFLNLVDNLIKAGYLEEWKYRPTLSGTPQGGIISPLLANIYGSSGNSARRFHKDVSRCVIMS
jgi:retron-type reverse transcriptase